MTQPALSRCLRQLEDSVGLLLVDRSTRHLRLTPEGELFRKKAAFALAAFTDAVEIREAISRPLCVGHAWLGIGRQTRNVVTRWAELHPESPLEFKRVDDRTAGLLSGVTDVAVLRGDIHEERLHLELFDKVGVIDLFGVALVEPDKRATSR